MYMLYTYQAVNFLYLCLELLWWKSLQMQAYSDKLYLHALNYIAVIETIFQNGE